MDYISINDEQLRRAIETATRNAQASIAWSKEEAQPDCMPDKARLLATLEQIERMTLQARADSPDQARNWFSHIRSVAGIARGAGNEVKASTESSPSDWTPEPWFLKHDGWTIRAVAEPQERICHTYTPADDAAKIDNEIIPEILRRWEAFPDLYAVLREFVIQHEMGLQHIEGLYDLARTALDKATSH